MPNKNIITIKCISVEYVVPTNQSTHESTWKPDYSWPYGANENNNKDELAQLQKQAS